MRQISVYAVDPQQCAEFLIPGLYPYLTQDEIACFKPEALYLGR